MLLNDQSIALRCTSAVLLYLLVELACLDSPKEYQLDSELSSSIKGFSGLQHLTCNHSDDYIQYIKTHLHLCDSLDVLHHMHPTIYSPLLKRNLHVIKHPLSIPEQNNVRTWYATAFNVRGFQHFRRLLILSTAWLLYGSRTLGDSESMTKAL